MALGKVMVNDSDTRRPLLDAAQNAPGVKMCSWEMMLTITMRFNRKAGAVVPEGKIRL